VLKRTSWEENSRNNIGTCGHQISGEKSLNRKAATPNCKSGQKRGGKKYKKGDSELQLT